MTTQETMRNRIALATVAAAILLLTVGLTPALAAPPVKVTSAVPSEAEEETLNLDVEISGGGFEPGAVAKFFRTGTSDPGGIVVNSTTYLSPKKVRANVDIPLGSSIDLYDIEIELKDTRRGKGIELFRVKEKTTGPPAQPTIVPLESLGGAHSFAADVLDPVGTDPIVLVGNADVETSNLDRAAKWEVDPTTYAVTGPIDLGTLPGGEFSEARRIATGGVIVGSSHDGTWRTTPSSDPDAVTQGVYWLAGELAPNALANLATVLGGLDPTCVAEYPEALAMDVSASGLIVGTSDHGACNADGWPYPTAVLWQLDAFGVASDPISVGSLTSDHVSWGYGVSDSGYVVGEMNEVGGRPRGFLIVPEDSDLDGQPDTWWRDDDLDDVNDLLIDLGEPPNSADWVEAWAVAENGVIVGKAKVMKGKSTDGWRAFRIVPEDDDGDGEPDTWVRIGRKGHNELMEVLPMLPVEFCSPGMKYSIGLDVVDDGTVVGYSSCVGVPDAARWDPSGNVEDLSALIQSGDGWEHLRTAAGLSGSGARIVGSGVRDDGRLLGYVITP